MVSVSLHLACLGCFASCFTCIQRLRGLGEADPIPCLRLGSWSGLDNQGTAFPRGLLLAQEWAVSHVRPMEVSPGPLVEIIGNQQCYAWTCSLWTHLDTAQGNPENDNNAKRNRARRWRDINFWCLFDFWLPRSSPAWSYPLEFTI